MSGSRNTFKRLSLPQVVSRERVADSRPCRPQLRSPSLLCAFFTGVVASPGRVLGDRSTLLKYLNPNLVAIVAISPATTSAAVHLIDSATGSLVHQIEALQDVNDESQLSLILQDNWIVLSYRLAADAARSPAIVSVELFHDSSPDSEEYVDRELYLSLVADRPFECRPHALSTPVRAFSRTFSSAQPLDIKTITRTKLGITTYSAICET